MTKLSVNINKIATLRNARGGNNPNVLKVAYDVETFGAQGITVHPRPDERHIRYQDVRDLRPQIQTEFNIEGNPIESFTQLVLEVKPTQVTLVPDGNDQITSNHGWDTLENRPFLTDICRVFKDAGIRVSIFVDAVVPIVWSCTPNPMPRAMPRIVRPPLPPSLLLPRRLAAWAWD